MRAWPVLLVAALSQACILSPLDTLGNETSVNEKESQSKETKIEDDRIEDKHPVFDPTRVVTEEFDGCEIKLNKSATVTKLDILPFEGGTASLQGALFPNRGAAIEEVRKLGGDLLPSMEVVNGAMKPFNDGLYAAIEMGLQNGAGAIAGKQAFLARLLARLDSELAGAGAAGGTLVEDAMVFVGAGMILGGATPSLPAALAARAQTEVDWFRKERPFYARPIGFYTWNKTLEGVFAQDRFFQNLDEPGDPGDHYPVGVFAALAAVIEKDPELLAAYQAILAVYAGLTNPYESYTPIDLFPYVDGVASLGDAAALAPFAAKPDPYVCTGQRLALFPASRSNDMDYLKGHYCGAAPALDTDLLDVLIGAIRSGELNLAPDGDAGWYDRQVHALESLLLPERAPESQHLLLTAAYKKKLIETFKSIITQTRETHVKQLGMGGDLTAAPPREIDIYPKLPVEPFPTFYLRTARAYRFLDAFLRSTVGAAVLDGEKRLYEDGTRAATPLGEELRRMTELLYGLAHLTARSLGMDPVAELVPEESVEYPMEACVARAKSWIATWRTDRDVLADPRVIVPVWNSQSTSTLIYWAVLGVKVIRVQAEFVKDHEPVVVDDGYCTVKQLVPKQYYLLMEHTEQVRTPGTVPPPTREEFRKICDEHKTKDGILGALAGGGD